MDGRDRLGGGGGRVGIGIAIDIGGALGGEEAERMRRPLIVAEGVRW